MSCSRHVRSSERSCPFCGAALALGERVMELRLLTPLDRGRMVALGALLSAAGIALGCAESVTPPPASAAEVPAAEPSAESPPETSPAPSAEPAAPPPGAPAAAYGGPPATPGSGLPQPKP